MKGIWQAVVVVLLGVAFLQAAEEPKAIEWKPLKVTESCFTQNLGMLDSERDEYATNLAGLAANRMLAAKASPEAISDARRMMGLALHLSPRNKRALVANFQLSKGVLPEAAKVDYSAEVFARLLLTRGQFLEKQGGAENLGLARMFIQLAAGLDPKNEDAVYASEVQRLDKGDVDWSAVTGDPAAKP